MLRPRIRDVEVLFAEIRTYEAELDGLNDYGADLFGAHQFWRGELSDKFMCRASSVAGERT
jgi:hypothetical protein